MTTMNNEDPADPSVQEWSREEWEKLDADMLALRKERDAANAVIDMAYRTLLGEGQEDQGAAYDNACRILGDRIEAARTLRKGTT